MTGMVMAPNGILSGWANQQVRGCFPRSIRMFILGLDQLDPDVQYILCHLLDMST